MKLFLKDANDVKLNSPDEVKKITIILEQNINKNEIIM